MSIVPMLAAITASNAAHRTTMRPYTGESGPFIGASPLTEPPIGPRTKAILVILGLTIVGIFLAILNQSGTPY